MLPKPRGPLSAHALEQLSCPPHGFSSPEPGGDAFDDDLQLALYLCYELHYRGFDGVDPGWEWEPSLISFRRSLENLFEAQVRRRVGPVDAPFDTAEELKTLARSDDGPSLASYLQAEADLDHFKEFVIHRSAYHLKEADPHTWAIPRLWGQAKASMVEIQADEYGSGAGGRIHARLFADAMTALGLDAAYGAYLDVIPGVTLATVNLMSLFGLNRRLRGATVGHLALFEMTSTSPNRRYAQGLRRLGAGDATEFFDEHVEADAVHAEIAAHDMAGSLARQEPSLASDIIFGAKALMELDRRFADHVLAAWGEGRSSLYRPESSLLAS